jgi:hypothetical protein
MMSSKVVAVALVVLLAGEAVGWALTGMPATARAC